jgi:hypothetical protein
MAVFWIVAPCSLVEVYRRFRGPCCLHHQVALMMEAASTSEMSVNFYQTTRRCNPEDSHPQFITPSSVRVVSSFAMRNFYMQYMNIKVKEEWKISKIAFGVYVHATEIYL